MNRNGLASLSFRHSVGPVGPPDSESVHRPPLNTAAFLLCGVTLLDARSPRKGGTEGIGSAPRPCATTNTLGGAYAHETHQAVTVW